MNPHTTLVEKFEKNHKEFFTKLTEIWGKMREFDKGINISVPLTRYNRVREDFLSAITEAENNKVGEFRELVKKVYQSAKEDHICRFNDGEQICDCYFSALNDLLSKYEVGDK